MPNIPCTGLDMLEAKTVMKGIKDSIEVEKDTIFVNWGLNMSSMSTSPKFCLWQKRGKNIIENKYTIYNSGRKCKKENNRLQGEVNFK